MRIKGTHIRKGEIVPQIDLTGLDPSRFSAAELRRIVRHATVINDNLAAQKFDFAFPDEGPSARHLYRKHLAFFEIGAEYRERCFMAAKERPFTSITVNMLRPLCALNLVIQRPSPPP